MKRIYTILLLAGVFAHAHTQAADDLPPFEEVFGLVNSNLAGAKPAEMNQAAVAGFLQQLSPRVTLVGASGESNTPTPTEIRSEESLFRQNTGYIRLNMVASGAAARVKESFDALMETNQLAGLVLDLRFAGGEDYAAAVAVADLFLAQEVPLLNWGEGLKRSHEKQSAIMLPVAVLVNSKTAEAAEALAAMLRQSGVALVLGGRTSGTAGIMRSFPLSTGQELRITVANVQLGNAKSLGTDGLRPDVEVKGSLADEKRFIEDPYFTPQAVNMTADETSSETNDLATARRPRVDEAALVRRWRGEPSLITDQGKKPPVETKQVCDPVLLRALDLMDGLAILRSSQR